jgi:hypothetical protein
VSVKDYTKLVIEGGFAAEYVGRVSSGDSMLQRRARNQSVQTTKKVSECVRGLQMDMILGNGTWGTSTLFSR